MLVNHYIQLTVLLNSTNNPQQDTEGESEAFEHILDIRQ